MAPLVVKGKVLVGNSGGELGVRGWLTALDAADGSLAWRAYSTGPDRDVLIGPRFKPFYPQDRGKDLGRPRLAAGRLADRRRHGLGLDLLRSRAEPDLLRHRQSRPLEPRAAARRQQVDRRHLRPRPGHRRGGLVLPVEPARPVRLRRDQREHPARPAEWAGSRARCSSARAQRLRLRDRPATGEVLSAEPFAHITTSKGRRPRRPAGLIYNPEKAEQVGKVTRDICPAAPGAKDWQPSAFSPRTGCSTSRTTTCAWTARDAGQLHRRHALRRRQGAHVRRAGRPSRRVHRLGPGRRRARGLDHQGGLPGLERRSPPRATSCSTAPWTAGSRPWTRAPASCCGSSRSAPGSSASPRSTAAPTASSTSPSSPASAAGRGDRRRRPRPARRHRRARLRQRHEGPAAAHDQGRHALCLRAAVAPG